MPSHLPWETLVAHADGTLPDSEAASVRAHLLRCPSCAEEARWLRHAVATMRDDAFPAPPASARAAVDAAYEARFGRASRAIPFPTTREEPALPRPPRPAPERERQWRIPTALYLWGGLAAAAVLVIALLLPRLQPGVQTAAGGSLLQASGGVTVTDPAGVERPAIGGESLAVGETLTVPPGGRIDFVVGNGSHHLALGEASVLTLIPGVTGEVVVRLDRGTLVAEGLAAERLTIEAAESQVRLTSGSARLELSADERLSVEARSGAVTVENPYGRRELSTGQSVIVLPGRAPEPAETLTPPVTPSPEASPPIEKTPTPDDEYDDNPSEDDLNEDSGGDSGSDDDVDNSGPGSVNSGRDR